MTLIKELKYDLNINGENITDLSDFESKWSINSARELKLLFESEKGALSEKYHLGDEIRFRYGVGKINPINDFHGVCQGIDLNEYSLLNYDWLTKLIDEEVKIKKSKYLGWEKMSVIQHTINESDIVQKLFYKGSVLINQGFESDPPDWKRHIEGPANNWFTHDAVNDDINVALKNDIEFEIQNRYSKSHIRMDDNDNFDFEQEYEATNSGTTHPLMGEFRSLDYEETNKKNMVGIWLSAGQDEYMAIIFDSDGGRHNGSAISAPINTKYKYKCNYDKNNRKLTVERWEGTIYKDKSEVILPSDKTFYVDDFGIGNYDVVLGIQSTGNYDSAYLEKVNIRTDKLKGTYPQQYVMPYDDLKNSLKENRFGFIMKVLDLMYDATNWHEIKLYEMWLRYDTLIIQKQRSLNSTPVMTIADADNLITTKPVIDKERICNQCAIIDKDDEDIYFVYSDESSIGAYGLFCKNFEYKAFGQVDKCQEIAMKYVAKHKLPTKVFGLSCADGYTLQLGDIVQVTADRYGIKGKYRITDIMTRARDLPSAEITVSDKQPDISEFL